MVFFHTILTHPGWGVSLGFGRTGRSWVVGRTGVVGRIEVVGRVVVDGWTGVYGRNGGT